MKSVIVAAMLALALDGAAQAAVAPSLVAKDATIKPAPMGLPTTAAYLTLKNAGDQPEHLLSATCDCAAVVQAHESSLVDGVMRMRPVDLVVPARGEVTLKPGGLHLMVIGLKRPIAPGDEVTITLRFDHAGPLPVRFTARP